VSEVGRLRASGCVAPQRGGGVCAEQGRSGPRGGGGGGVRGGGGQGAGELWRGLAGEGADEGAVGGSRGAGGAARGAGPQRGS